MGRDNRDPWEVHSQVSIDSLCWTSDVVTNEVEVPHADHHRGWKIHGPGGGVFVKQFSTKNTETGEYLREAEEDTGSRRQNGRSQDPEPHRNGR